MNISIPPIILSFFRSVVDVHDFNSSKFAVSAAITFFTLILMLYTENFGSNIVEKYETLFGAKSWDPVRRISVLLGAGSGLMATLGNMVWGDGFYMYFIVNLATIAGYITGQALSTDFSLHLVDRFMLRIAYIDTFIATVFVLANSGQIANGHFTVLIMPILLYLVLGVLFFFSGAGPSDIRAIMVVLPLTVVMNVNVSMVLFVVAMLSTIAFMIIRKRGKITSYTAAPILPFIVTPYVILLPFFGLLIETMTGTL